MMPRDTSCLCKCRVIIGDNQAIDRVGIYLSGHFLCPFCNHLLYILQGGDLYLLAFYGFHAVLFEPVHTCSPRVYRLFCIDQCKGYPVEVTLSDFVYILQCQRTRGQVARVGIFFIALDIELFEVCITDNTFSPNYNMPLGLNLLGDALNGIGQMSDICSDMPIASCHHFCKLSIVESDYKCQAIKLPTEPDWTSLGPFSKLCGLFGLGQ